MVPDTSAAENGARAVDCTLIQRLRRGDKDAFAEVYDRYSRIVFGLILRMVRNPALAEDLLQEIFIKLWRSAPSLDENATSLGPWLVAVARHHVLDYIKSGHNRQAMKAVVIDFSELANHLSLPEYDFVCEERAQLLRNSLDRLEGRQKQLLELAYFDGLTQTEMAAALSMPLGTVKSCVRVALRNLKKDLEENKSGR